MGSACARPRYPFLRGAHRSAERGIGVMLQLAHVVLSRDCPASPGQVLRTCKSSRPQPPPGTASSSSSQGSNSEAAPRSGEELRLRTQRELGSSPSSAFHSCVALGKSLHFSGPHFLLCKWRLMTPAGGGSGRLQAGPIHTYKLCFSLAITDVYKSLDHPAQNPALYPPFLLFLHSRPNVLFWGVNSSLPAKLTDFLCRFCPPGVPHPSLSAPRLSLGSLEPLTSSPPL